jgi:hypothetical protein
MWQFRLIELLSYCLPFTNFHLHCLDRRESVFLKYCLNIFICSCGFLSGLVAPKCDWLELHLNLFQILIRPTAN